MSEVWKPVKGYEGYYEVSNLGRVKSKARKYYRSDVLYHLKERVMKVSPSSSGYNTIILTVNGKAKSYLLHRLIALAFIENPQNKKCINHKDGDKFNNSLENLEWCTYSENRNHGLRTGLIKQKRATHSHAKLTEDDVKFIKKMYSYTYCGYSDIAWFYPVGHDAIRNIILGEKWK